MISASQPSDCLHVKNDDMTTNDITVEFTSGHVSKDRTTLRKECKEAVHHLLSTYSPTLMNICPSQFPVEIEENIHVNGKTYTTICNSDQNSAHLLRYVQIALWYYGRPEFRFRS